jgi:hypothetical protein
MHRLVSKRSLVALAVLLGAVLLVIYQGTRPRLAPGQVPLADISRIDTIRTQFNQDAGKTRLIILVSPT